MKKNEKVMPEWVPKEAVSADEMITVISGFSGQPYSVVYTVYTAIIQCLTTVNQQGLGWRIMGVGALSYRLDRHQRIEGHVVTDAAGILKSKTVAQKVIIEDLSQRLVMSQTVCEEWWRTYCECVKLLIERGHAVLFSNLGALKIHKETYQWSLSPLAMLNIIKTIH